MLETKFNKEGYCVAYIEWLIVDKYGIGRADGEYIFLRDLWIHKDYERKKVINDFIGIILDKGPYCLYGYYLRRKYKDRVRLFNRERFNGRKRNSNPATPSSSST